jgi:ribosome biogenesis GTPase
VVIKKSQGIYEVEAGEQMLRCELSSRLRKNLIYPTASITSRRHRVLAVADINQQDPVAIGDQVLFGPMGEGGGLITEVLPRRNALSRPAAGDRPLEQVIVANVDQVVAVFSAAQPSPKWELLDRYVVAAEAAGVPTLLAVTKLDLLPDSDEWLQAEVDNYQRLGYRAILSSIVTGAGLDELAAALRGRVSVFVGKSGVGKSSLLNAIEPGLGQRVKAVSELTGKGKHTTSRLEMFPLANGGRVVDTPGMREFGLWQLDPAGLAAGFVEMRPYLGRCKFGLDCAHDHEPGCAVQAAVAAGAISERRYHSYLRMQGD